MKAEEADWTGDEQEVSEEESENESTSIIKVRVVEGLVSLLWIDVTESRQLNFNLAIKLTLNV